MRVLQVVSNMNRGGLQVMLMNYYRKIDREKLQFDFLEHYQQKAAFDDEVEALGGKIYRLPALQPFSISYRRALKRFFDEHPEYQIVHVHLNCLSSIILKEAQKHGVPVRIAHSHNVAQDKNLKYPIKMFYMKYIPQYASHLLACSEAAGKWMFRNANFQVLHNAIDAAAYVFDAKIRMEARKGLGISDNTVLVGHIGRFDPQKNHSFLIDVFAETQKKLDAKLILVGEGSLRKDIEKKVNELGLTEKVIFTGERTDVPNLLQAMDVFLLPSNYEGLGIVAIEAQAAGLPCIISDKVPKESMITDLVRQISLSDSVSVWADGLVSAMRTGRKNTFEEIKAAGYDIEENAKIYQRFYTTLYCNL